MKWQHKRAVQKLFGTNELARKAYYHLTVDRMRSRGGEPRKWCFWFREHALLIRRKIKRPALRGTVWCIDPGFTHTAPLLLRLSADRVVVTSRFGRLAPAYLQASGDRIRQDLGDFARILQLPANQAEDRLDQAVAQLAGNGADWLDFRATRGVPALPDLPDASIDDIISMGTLEHYTPEELERLFREMWRVLKPGGVTSHIIDLRDHFHHADAALHPLNHLRYPRAEWQALTSPISYTNQLRRSHYLGLIARTGFELLYAGYDPHGSYPPLGDEIAPEHRTLDPLDDEARVTHVIAVKR